MHQNGWKFVDKKGTFVLENPTMSNYLYFPLVNEAGMMSSITPTLHGDINTSQNSFVTEPVSAIDLHNNKASRNFWLLIDNQEVWSATGYSSKQETEKFNDVETSKLEASMLYHQMTRENKDIGIRSEITNFVPVSDDQVELMQVTIRNTGKNIKDIKATSAIPLYGRSADNLRDHRHVTSLLNVIMTLKDGIDLTPTLSFDERGHRINDRSYKVVGRCDEGKSPVGFYPVYEDFIGEGGSLTWPKAIVNDEDPTEAGKIIEGYEAIGALKFEAFTLAPGAEKTFVLAIVTSNQLEEKNFTDQYCSVEAFNKYLDENKKYWQNLINKVQFNSNDNNFDQWMKWVTIQPTLRRLFGNSFLPHHDYGRGGRGWRDLWQDALALLLMDPAPVRDMLFDSFAGVRIDGSNATIIGSKPGEFIADRNGISRVWMDHGAWPFLTTKLYIDRSGDLDFLLEKQSYFRDPLMNRSKKFDENWSIEAGNALLDKDNNVYEGTLLEHILVQHLSVFFNVGEHNNLKLEGGDWNDGLDMAEEKGESVPFTALYGSNMLELAKLLKHFKDELSLESVTLAKEIKILLDTMDTPVDYSNVSDKIEHLDKYFEAVAYKVSGTQEEVLLDDLIKDLERKGQWIVKHIRENEWIKNKEGYAWYNAYYDNDGDRLEGDHEKGVRMTLTGQVFPIMGNVATEDEIKDITKAADHYLKNDAVGGYRLNTPLNEVKLNLGRAFGFAYGEKENGAMFSHMAVMYGNALYQRNFSEKGFEVIDSIYNHCKDFEKSRIYPGIPEYIDARGRGLYHFLTGSASWLLLTMVDQVYGVQGKLGNLKLDPKLVASQFDVDNKASITTYFADRKLEIIYRNNNLASVGNYAVKAITINGQSIDFDLEDQSAVINRNVINDLETDKCHRVLVILN